MKRIIMKVKFFLLVILCICGCGVDESEMPEFLPANFVSATPHNLCDVAANGSITVTFDNPPRDVTVSAGIVTVAGKSATITGPFTPGPLALTITWADGTQTLSCAF